MFSNLSAQLQSMLFIAPVMLIAIVSHECAHGWVSDKLGDPTPKQSGRLSLNPFKHLDLAGALCMLIFHVGWAKPVPINPMYYKDRRKGLIMVSCAGPAVNFIIAFLSLVMEGLFLRLGSHSSIIIWILCQLCYYSAVLNVGLALFNLVPIPPLDGSRVAECLSGKVSAFYWRYQKYWRIVLLICVFTGLLSRPLGLLNNLVTDGMWFVVYHLIW